MRSGKASLLLLATVLVVGGTLVLVDGILGSVGSDTSSFFGCLNTLEREHELSQQLDEAFQKTLEISGRKNQIVDDLVGQRCDLVEAVARYRELCRPGDLLSFRAMYRLLSAPEEEVVVEHLLLLVRRGASKQPDLRAELLNRLEKEANRLRSENAVVPNGTSSSRGA